MTSTLASVLAALSLAFVLGGSASASPAHETTAKPDTTGFLAVTPPTLPTRAELQAHRHEQIARLQAYADAGVFPRNYPDVNHVHMFKDPDGRYCAVANLIHQDGHDDVVDRLALQNNGFTVTSDDDTDVDAWIRTSGLTREEVARIQRPAPTVMRRAPAVLQMQRKLAQDDTTTTPKPVTEAAMAHALQAQIATIETELAAEEEASLDQAMARLQDAPL